MIYWVTKLKKYIRFSTLSVTALKKFLDENIPRYNIIVYNFYFKGIFTILLENSLVTNYFKYVSSAIAMFFML